jgi:CheY-like chemotaxis protein
MHEGPPHIGPADSEQLASVGRIAGGIAHEIGNPAALIAANLELLREQLESTSLPGALQMLDECMVAISRIGTVIADLRDPASVGHAPIDVCSVPRPNQQAPRTQHQRARVLLVDDEVELLGAYARLLSREYEVVTARDGLRALCAIEEASEPFDAIVCDLVMPEIDGQELYDRLESLGVPTTNVIFATGGASTEVARRFLDGIDNPVLYKPFRGADLRRAIQATIDDRDPRLAVVL